MAMSTNEQLADQIDEARAGLYALLLDQDPAVLARRPSSGEWSVVEHVRHLLYAEQLHLRLLLPDGFTWSPLGLPTDGRPRRSGAGSQSTDDLAAVLAAWDAVHEPVRSAVRGGDDAARALQRNLRHLRSHIRTIRARLEKHRS